MIYLTASIEGEKQLSRRLMIASDGVSDFSVPLGKIGGELLRATDLQFQTEGKLYGGWPPRRDNKPHPLLQLTGRLRHSFSDEVRKDFVRVFSSGVPYFKYHQSNKPRSRLPRRVMLKIDNQRKTFIVKAFQEYIVKKLRGQ